MDLVMKQKWCEELRSGRYIQGQRRLRTKENKFCCLGVLCDLVNPQGWKEDCSDNCYSFRFDREVTTGVLPGVIINKYEIHKSDESKLISLNDDGKSFDQIANYIEKFL